MTKMHHMTTLSIAGEEAGKKLIDAARSGDSIAMGRVLEGHKALIVEHAPKDAVPSELNAHIQAHMHPLIHTVDGDGNTALHHAASHTKKGPREALVKRLVEAGADMGVRNKSGNTPLGMVPAQKNWGDRLAQATANMPTSSAWLGGM